MRLRRRLRNRADLRRASIDAKREVVKSDDEWREQLTAEQYRILRRAGTEPPFRTRPPVADNHGMYRCAGCEATLFAADAKFDSGTGWPSFTDAVAGAVELRRDFTMGIPRTEVVCRRCGGHLGHVFNDGPGPTRKRYCINGCAFSAAASPEA